MPPRGGFRSCTGARTGISGSSSPKRNIGSSSGAAVDSSSSALLSCNDLQGRESNEHLYNRRAARSPATSTPWEPTGKRYRTDAGSTTTGASMDLELTAEHRTIRDMVRDFAAREIAPRAAHYDRTREFPHDNVRKCAELNLMGVMVPEQFGGSGLDTISYALIIEELSRACASTGVIVSVNNSLFCHPVERFGTEDQKQRFLIPHAKGEKIGCFCLSEPAAGSDAGNQQTTAVRRGDEYILNGTKNFITNGVAADTAIV